MIHNNNRKPFLYKKYFNNPLIHSFFNKIFNSSEKISNSYIIFLALLCNENNNIYQCCDFNDDSWN